MRSLGTILEIFGTVRQVIVFSNELCIDRKVNLTMCFVMVDKSFKAPTGMEYLFFATPSLLAKFSVTKLADEQVSSKARPRIN